MRGLATPEIARGLPWRYMPRLPTARKSWAVVAVAVLVAVLLLAGLMRVFNTGFGSDEDRANAPSLEWRDMMGMLMRYGVRPAESNEAVGLDVLLATPHYFGALHRQPPAEALAEPSVLFYVTETTHIDDLPASAPEPLLRVDGISRGPLTRTVMADSYHHRTTLVRYSAEDLRETSVVELIFPTPDGSESDTNVVRWTLPLEYTDTYSTADIALGVGGAGSVVPAVGGVALLAVFGGLLAAMWPCLFQLTAYFIPAMAGMSMQDASKASGVRPRVGVVRIAVFFVLGFTIVYTAAGAVIGYGSQQLSNIESFYLWQRYLSIGAGVILFGMALRVAAKARAPLVCKMPILRRSSARGMTSPWESMVVGITFATGCMTCFGSAVLIGMVLYVGLAGSPLVGATLLFLFSLGMGVPLVIGAIAMARVLPMLFRIEKAIPWMGLASAVLIASYATLLITGNFMAMAEWFYRLTGVGASV